MSFSSDNIVCTTDELMINENEFINSLSFVVGTSSRDKIESTTYYMTEGEYVVKVTHKHYCFFNEKDFKELFDEVLTD